MVGGLGLVLGELGDALVLDVSDVSAVAGHAVGDDLGAAVGKGDGVAAGGVVSVTVLVLAEGGLGVVVGDAVLEGVCWGNVSGLGVGSWVGGGVVGGGGVDNWDGVGPDHWHDWGDLKRFDELKSN